ncbi:MAG: phosphatase PAP2 family protein [Candidatus Limnocylindrales bacterium]
MTPPASPPSELGERNSRLLLIGVALYVAVLSGLMIARGIGVTPDVLLVGFGLAAVVLGRGRLFFRDWVPFIALFFAYELMRGYADDFGMAIHVTDVIAIDRIIGFGRLPTQWLQGWFHPAAGPDLVAVGATVVYFLHFPLPLAVGFLLWLKRRALYYDFVAAMIVLCLAGFVTFLFVPVAPPWWAAQHGFLNGANGRPLIEYLKPVGFDQLATWLGFNGHYIYTYTFYDIGPNEVAAFPSLHAAFPFLAFLFARRGFGRVGWAVLGYFALVVFSIVYLGDHYVVDAIAGVAYASASYALVAHAPAWFRGLLDRVRDDALAQPGLSGMPGTASVAQRVQVAWRRVALGLGAAGVGALGVGALAWRGAQAGSFAYAIPAALVLVGGSVAAAGLFRR